MSKNTKSNILKNFIIDTNVLIDDPDAIFKMGEHNVIIPDVVIEELDHFKTERSDRGNAVKRASHHLDNLGKQGNLKQGVPLGEGKGMLSLEFTAREKDLKSPFKYDLSIFDNRILWLGYEHQKSANPNNVFIIVTKDTNLRVKANTLNIPVEEYKNEDVLYSTKQEKTYTGRTTVFLPGNILHQYKQMKSLDLAVVLKQGFNSVGDRFKEPVYVNEFFELYSCEQPTGSCLMGRYDGKSIVPLRYTDSKMHGISPRNVGQHFMKECLLAPPEEAPLVIIKGIAGTGKTLFTLAAGLENYSKSSLGQYHSKSKKSKGYNKILICRPSTTMDENLGFLPGNESEKIEPYMRPIKDNLFTILHGDAVMEPYEMKQAEDEVNAMFTDDYIKTEALAFQRGRSLNHYWFILDEMQNATRNQAKTIATRGGVGTKIIMLGDPDQIDNPYLTSTSNGLVYASESMKGSKLCWQVTLTENEGERSPLAQEAANRMK